MSFPAKRLGRCATCEKPITVGSLIRRVPGLPRNGAGYEHDECAAVRRG